MGRVLRLFVFVIAALSVLTVTVPTEAQTTPTPADCQATITDLSEDTAVATFLTTGKNAGKDEAGLLAKLDSAADKLAAGKFQDSFDALTQFRDKVADLQGAGKIDSENAAELIEGANAAIACVEQLLEETPTA